MNIELKKKKTSSSKRGNTLLEYALVATILAICSIVSLTVVAGNLGIIFTKIAKLSG